MAMCLESKCCSEGILVRQVGRVDGACLCGDMGEVRAALPPGFGQDPMKEAGGSLKNATSHRGSAVECWGTPNAVLPG